MSIFTLGDTFKSELQQRQLIFNGLRATAKTHSTVYHFLNADKQKVLKLRLYHPYYDHLNDDFSLWAVTDFNILNIKEYKFAGKKPSTEYHVDSITLTNPRNGQQLIITSRPNQSTEQIQEIKKRAEDEHDDGLAPIFATALNSLAPTYKVNDVTYYGADDVEQSEQFSLNGLDTIATSWIVIDIPQRNVFNEIIAVARRGNARGEALATISLVDAPNAQNFRVGQIITGDVMFNIVKNLKIDTQLTKSQRNKWFFNYSVKDN